MSTVRVSTYQHQPKKSKYLDNISFKLLEKKIGVHDSQKLKLSLTNCLIICLVVFVCAQVSRGIYLSLDRYLTLSFKMNELQQLKNKATYQNAVLKKSYKNYTTPEGLEGLARDNLNLVGDDEIAIIIKNS